MLKSSNLPIWVREIYVLAPSSWQPNVIRTAIRPRLAVILLSGFFFLKKKEVPDDFQVTHFCSLRLLVFSSAPIFDCLPCGHHLKVIQTQQCRSFYCLDKSVFFHNHVAMNLH